MKQILGEYCWAELPGICPWLSSQGTTCPVGVGEGWAGFGTSLWLVWGQSPTRAAPELAWLSLAKSSAARPWGSFCALVSSAPWLGLSRGEVRTALLPAPGSWDLRPCSHSLVPGLGAHRAGPGRGICAAGTDNRWREAGLGVTTQKGIESTRGCGV